MSNKNLATLEFTDNSPKAKKRVDTQTHIYSDSNDYRASIHGFATENKIKEEDSTDAIDTIVPVKNDPS